MELTDEQLAEYKRIGREADNDLVLESDSCSRYHAEILFGRGLYKVVDLNSTNGISVNGQIANWEWERRYCSDALRRAVLKGKGRDYVRLYKALRRAGNGMYKASVYCASIHDW